MHGNIMMRECAGLRPGEQLFTCILIQVGPHLRTGKRGTATHREVYLLRGKLIAHAGSSKRIRPPCQPTHGDECNDGDHAEHSKYLIDCLSPYLCYFCPSHFPPFFCYAVSHKTIAQDAYACHIPGAEAYTDIYDTPVRAISHRTLITANARTIQACIMVGASRMRWHSRRGDRRNRTPIHAPQSPEACCHCTKFKPAE